MQWRPQGFVSPSSGDSRRRSPRASADRIRYPKTKLAVRSRYSASSPSIRTSAAVTPSMPPRRRHRDTRARGPQIYLLRGPGQLRAGSIRRAERSSVDDRDQQPRQWSKALFLNRSTADCARNVASKTASQSAALGPMSLAIRGPMREAIGKASPFLQRDELGALAERVPALSSAVQQPLRRQHREEDAIERRAKERPGRRAHPV